MANCTICNKHFFCKKKLHDGLCFKCLAKHAKETTAQLKKTKENLEETKKQLCELQKSIPSDAKAYEELKIRNSEISLKNTEMTYQINALSQKLKALQKKIIVAEETIELEEFSLYSPKFDFCNSDLYREKLDEVRENEKYMIKAKTAWVCGKKWAVSGDEKKGQKMVEGQAKVALRAFNIECDAAVAAVKFNTFDRCVERIKKSYETINKSNESIELTISSDYALLKIEELRIALEYQKKKQEEKEAAKELRAQLREEARLAKEIEEARKETEKEKEHYLNALSKIKSQISTCTDETEREALAAREKELHEGLASVELKLADIDYRQENQKAGYVYVISNIGSFGEGVYKIGMTRRLDPMERIDELGDASVPFKFDIHAMIFSSDAPKLETALHHAFESKRVNKVNNRREYFRVGLDEIKEVIKNNHDKTVEFIDVPEAIQYRESLMM